MDLYKGKYIIVEIIPTRNTKECGFIAQISALKLEGIQLKDRFDYRVEDHFIDNPDIRQMIQYDKKSFTYVPNIYFMLEKFKQWAKNYPLLLIDDTYTLSYLDELENPKELVFPYLGLEYTDDVFQRMIKKYHLQPSDHLVDLVYESIIYEGNNQKKYRKSNPNE